MKTYFFKISVFFLLAVLMGAGCKKEEISYADESIQVSSFPSISVYKTKVDYFDFISLQLTSTGEPNGIPDLTLNSPAVNVDKSGRITTNFRWRLKSGYIVDLSSYVDRVYTDITFKEYIAYNTANKVACWPNNLIKPRIIDENPFNEYYHYSGLNKNERVFTLGEINTMIENGTIETVFERLK